MAPVAEDRLPGRLPDPAGRLVLAGVQVAIEAREVAGRDLDARLDVLLAPAIGAAPATPAPTVVAPMHVKPWIGGALTLLAAAILVFLGYRTRGPKLGLED
jgi:hypothetical protein